LMKADPMEPEEIADLAFSVEEVRSVGIIATNFEIKLSRVRKSVKSRIREEIYREFIEFIPEILLGLTEKLQNDLGDTRYAVLCFSKLTLLLFKSYGYIVVLSIDPGTSARSVFNRLAPTLGIEPIARK